MKKIIKKSLICISAITMCFTCGISATASDLIPLTPAIEEDINDCDEIVELDTKGLLNFSRDYYKLYYCKKKNGKCILRTIKPCYDRFEFILKDGNYKAVEKRICEIISEYYPLDYDCVVACEYDSKYTSKDRRVYFDIGSHYIHTEEAMCTVGFDLKEEVISLDDEDKKNMAEIFSKLKEEDLISEFYEAGQIYEGGCMILSDYFVYNTYEQNISAEEIQKFIDENELHCTMKAGEQDYMPCHFLVPDKEMEFEEYFNVVTKIYEKLNYRPYMSFTTTSVVYGKNLVENDTDSTATDKIVEFKKGDSNNDGVVNVRDCSFMTLKFAMNDVDNLSKESDYNEDDSIDVRDAAAIASDLAKR